MLTDGIDRTLDSANITQNISYYWKAKQWQIKGVPFSGNVNHGVDQRLIIHQLTKILKHFHNLGWRLVASADISAKYHKSNNQEYPLDTHSWFFLHDPDSIVMTDTIVTNIDTGQEEESGGEEQPDTFTVEQIKAEKTRCRIFLRVQLPFGVILIFIMWYVFSIIGFV